EDIINLKVGETILTGKRYKHVYTADISSVSKEDWICLSVMDSDLFLWHKALDMQVSETGIDIESDAKSRDEK
ncbi:hypothetical protein HAX54_039298, partial [Datura stramonium]|nr:hypothetical protein [Datura stramonium]